MEFHVYVELSVRVTQRDVSLPHFGVFPITAYSLLVILLKWMGGLHKEHYTTLCEEQLNDLTQLAAVRNYPFYISPAHRRNE